MNFHKGKANMHQVDEDTNKDLPFEGKHASLLTIKESPLLC